MRRHVLHAQENSILVIRDAYETELYEIYLFQLRSRLREREREREFFQFSREWKNLIARILLGRVFLSRARIISSKKKKIETCGSLRTKVDATRRFINGIFLKMFLIFTRIEENLRRIRIYSRLKSKL